MFLPSSAVQGFSPDQAALLAVKRSIPNWDLYQQRSMCFGWHEKPYDDVCKWTSVTCRDGRVIGIHFQRNASYHLGNAPLCQRLSRLKVQQSAHMSTA